jgi:hypothetical protein
MLHDATTNYIALHNITRRTSIYIPTLLLYLAPPPLKYTNNKERIQLIKIESNHIQHTYQPHHTTSHHPLSTAFPSTAHLSSTLMRKKRYYQSLY